MRPWRVGKLSQIKIGRQLGIDNSTVSKWVNGVSVPR